MESCAGRYQCSQPNLDGKMEGLDGGHGHDKQAWKMHSSLSLSESALPRAVSEW